MGNPSSLSNLFKYPNRLTKDIIPLEELKCKYTKNFFLYKAMSLYNELGSVIKLLSPFKFKAKVRKVLGYDGIHI